MLIEIRLKHVVPAAFNQFKLNRVLCVSAVILVCITGLCTVKVNIAAGIDRKMLIL